MLVLHVAEWAVMMKVDGWLGATSEVTEDQLRLHGDEEPELTFDVEICDGQMTINDAAMK